MNKLIITFNLYAIYAIFVNEMHKIEKDLIKFISLKVFII